jgi:hypothetical protein
MIKVALMLGMPASSTTSPLFSSSQMSQRVAGASAPRQEDADLAEDLARPEVAQHLLPAIQ